MEKVLEDLSLEVTAGGLGGGTIEKKDRNSN